MALPRLGWGWLGLLVAWACLGPPCPAVAALGAPTPVQQWSKAEVAAWVGTLGLGLDPAAFEAQNIGGSALWYVVNAAGDGDDEDGRKVVQALKLDDEEVRRSLRNALSQKLVEVEDQRFRRRLWGRTLPEGSVVPRSAEELGAWPVRRLKGFLRWAGGGGPNLAMVGAEKKDLVAAAIDVFRTLEQPGHQAMTDEPS
eukprot:EG_transcript_24599